MLDKMRDNAQSWGIKILFGVIILAFIFAFGSPGGGQEQVVATVKGEPIAKADFEKRLPREGGGTTEQRWAILSGMIRDTLLSQLAGDLGVTASEPEVVRLIAAMPEFQTDGSFDLARYKAALGNNAEYFEESQAMDLVMKKMGHYVQLPAVPTEDEARALFEWQNRQAVVEYIEILSEDFVYDAEVSDMEIEQFYNANMNRYVEPAKIKMQYVIFSPATLAPSQEVTDADVVQYYEEMQATLVKGRQLQFRHILVPVAPNPTQADVDKAMAKTVKAKERIDAGEDFKSLAREFALADDEAPGEPKWMDPSLMPKELAAAFQSLGKGDVTGPVITHQGFNFVQLVDIEEARQLTLEEADAVIRERIALEKGAAIVDDQVEETIAQLSQGMQIAEIAESMDLTAIDSEPMAQQALVDDFGLTPEAAETLFSLVVGTSTRTPLRLADGGYLLAQKTEDMPQLTLPLENVMQDVTDELRKRKAVRLAMEQAETVLLEATATDGTGEALAEYLPRLVESEPFFRHSPPQALRNDPNLARDAFMATEGQWLPATYPGEAGFIVARLKTLTPAPGDLWESQKSGWLQQAHEIARNELLNATFGSMFNEARDAGEIVVTRPDLME